MCNATRTALTLFAVEACANQFSIQGAVDVWNVHYAEDDSQG